MARRLPSFAATNGIDPMDHERLVMFWAKKYGAAPGRIRDSEQYANGWIGLLMAADRFDPSRGVAFSTYASPWIRQAITRPRMLCAGAMERKTVCASQLGEADSKRPLGKDLAVDRLPQSHENVSGREEHHESQRIAATLLSHLDQRTERFVRLYVMDGLTLEETGNVMGVTRERVRQIVGKALRKMQVMAERRGLTWAIATMEILER